MRRIGLIFDMDGTLWDARKEVAACWSVVTRKHGLKEITFEDMTKTMGLSMEGIADALFPNLSKKERIFLLYECTDYENEYLKIHTPRLYPFLEKNLRILKERGFFLSILSNAQKGYIEAFFAGTGLSDLFIDHLCWGDNGFPKSKNMLLLKERNHFDDIFYIGDTRMDEIESDKAGAKFIYASYGFGEAKHPFFVLNQFEDLLKAPYFCENSEKHS